MRTFRTLGVVAATALALGSVAAAPVFHVGVERANNSAYVFDWRGAAATVVTTLGRTEATVVTTGLERLATLAVPLTSTSEISDPDCPDDIVEVRRDVLRMAVTRLTGNENRGTSKVVDIGTDTTLSGCNAGRVVPFGAPGDAGFQTQHLAARLRPSTADLSPGAALAGPSEQAGLDAFPAADIVTFGPGTMQFGGSGSVVPYVTVDGWLVNTLPSGERGHTRFAVDRNGAETWVVADWSAGQPQRVFRTLMVKPAPGAGFGSISRASRIWESGLFVGTPTPFSIWLYTDGSGERVSLDPTTGVETRSPITWAFDGPDIVQRRTLGSSVGNRRWEPLRNSGRARFLMEYETRTLPDGTVVPFIQPRVNFYVDNGPATPPTPSR